MPASTLEQTGEASHALVEDPGRDVVKRVFLPTEDDGVARVRSALVAHDDAESRREQVDDLALAFVTPLGPDDREMRHGLTPQRARRGMGPLRAAAQYTPL